MILSDVMDEIGEVLETIPGLNVYPHPADEVTPPAAMVTYPEGMDLERAFQRGTDVWSGGVIVLVDRVFDKSTRDQLSRYTAGDGPESIVNAFRWHDWQACAYAKPERVTFEPIQVAGVDYMAALFELEIAGPGLQEG